MANLPETSNFDAGVYEIATTDLVLGDLAGPANAPGINLANRTRWLFDQNTTNVANIAANAAAIATKAPLASPAFSGTPTAPTPGGGDNSTKIATTAFVVNALVGLAPLASPAFSGFPTVPTPPVGDSTTKIATTAFVNPNSSIGATGHRENADGEIEQWGTVSLGDVVSPAHATISFPIAFPSSCFQVEVSATDLNTGNFSIGVTYTVMTFGWSAAGFTYGARELVSTVQNAVLTWRAIGN